MKKSLLRILCVGFTLALFCSCQKSTSESESGYYSMDDYTNVKKADVHVHIHTDRDYFVQQAEKDNFYLLTICLDADNALDSIKHQYASSLKQVRSFPDQVEFTTAFSMEGWDDPGWTDSTIAWLQKGFDDGAAGVKVWKNVGMVFRDKNDSLVMIDDPRFDPVFKMIADQKKTLVGHLGEPKNCWLPLEEMTTNNDSSYFAEHPQYHMYKHPEFPSYEDQINARDRMLEKNPELIFVGAHLASLEWDVDALVERLEKFPNMAVDMAARMGQLFYQTHDDREKVRAFFIKYQDRLLYATDLGDDGDSPKEQLWQQMHDTWSRDWRFFVTQDSMTSNLVDKPFQGLRLPKEVVDKIYFLNAKKWFKIFDKERQ